MNRSKKNKKMGLPTKLILWFFGILVLLALLAVIYLGFKIFSVGGSIHNPLDRDKSSLRDKDVNLDDGDPFTVALFGVDSDAKRDAEGGGQRSDTVMVLSINPQKKTTEIVSIPRDTQAEIVGKGTTEKINHAYAYGGPDMAVKSVENLLNVPIDHYATIDMDGMQDMIDTVGGINVTSNASFSYDGYQFSEGVQSHMDGEEAMAFIRSRKEEGAGGDFGRQERQQLVIQGLANKLTSISSVTHFNSLMNHVEDNVKTDLTVGELNKIRSNYNDANEQVNRHQLDGQGGIQDDGLYYFIPSESSLSEIEASIKDNLGM
ncbi:MULTISPECIES: LCP family glycopolymer transferase [Staphylococcus]|uniref:LCP family protein n=2 Tax=Staphylococcus equorum TaxID=246432 RepID=A0A1E5TKD4_9STAP|nr:MULTISPECIES: LCP family protein [Staphylococcus]ALM57759.1 LytR family transcriptional regulator [Staphylococcus equorum]ANR68792.1 LytR family transcriptional regulator [Staphylococcus equorum]EJX18748.1 transcriptional regulator [Staphylococcus sp. OJ82]ERH36277.1 LytR family transcriptional regulator [Staphylococcus equorum UMC-CNS-924]MCE5007413.1 LCP family protein [Staphylococcus equorum]